MRFRTAGLILAASLFVLCTACSGTPSAATAQNGDLAAIFQDYPELRDKKPQTFKVKRVVDGDTIETDTKEKLRFIGVDTPETVKPNTPVQPYGKEASDYTKKRLTGKTIVTFADVDDKDKYGRLLRYVFVQGEKRMYNEELAAEGYAHVMTIPPNVMYSKTFLKDEREAREKKKGLWSDAYADPSPSPKSK